VIIGIDASRAFIEKRTGIEEYSYQIIRHLRNKLDSAQVVLYIRGEQESVIRKQGFILPKNWKVRIIRFPYLWTQLGLSLELLFHPVDILFIPAHVVPAIHPKNTVVTIHGLEYEFFPEGYSFWARLYMRWSIKLSCRWAKKIIAVSKNTKKDLINMYKVPESKIEVIYEGTDLVQTSKFKVQSFISKLKVEKPYLLFIGRLEKRKNIEGILETYKILKEKYKIPHKLILAGKPGYGHENIMYKASCIKDKKDIIIPGFIKDEEKLELIKNADVFLFPTLYEGFGLPILEAQVLGVPVVTSNISSLPEVGGDSVVYVNSHKPEEIAKATFKLIQDKDLREDMVKKGYENIKRFSWEKCADEISEVLKGK